MRVAFAFHGGVARIQVGHGDHRLRGVVRPGLAGHGEERTGRFVRRGYPAIVADLPGYGVKQSRRAGLRFAGFGLAGESQQQEAESGGEAAVTVHVKKSPLGEAGTDDARRCGTF